MGLFSGPIGEATQTKILVGKVFPARVDAEKRGPTKRLVKTIIGARQLQLTVYANIVSIHSRQTDNNCYMILPIPLIKGRNRIKILQFERYTDIFGSFDRMMSHARRGGAESGGIDWDAVFNPKKQKALIEITDKKRYRAYLVPSYTALAKSSEDKFAISGDLIKKIEAFYAKGFAFIICSIDKSAQYKPIGYIHEIRDDGRLFIPTRIAHGKITAEPFKYFDPTPESAVAEDRSKHIRFSSSVKTRDDDLAEIDLGRHMSQTMLDDDAWLRQSSKRTGINSHQDAILDREQVIYVLNATRLTQYKPPRGLIVDRLSAGTLKEQDKFINRSKLPHNIAFPSITNIWRISIQPDYKHNHDLII